MSAVTQITIAGFSGRMAQLITKYLLTNYPTVKINGIARNASKVPEEVRSNANVTVFEADAFDKAALIKALTGSQVAICGYLGDNHLMNAGQKLLIDASIEAGVPRYIAGDWTCEYRNLEEGEMPFKDPMRHVYSYLQSKDQIEGVHVFTGAFTEVVFLRLFADEAHTKIQYFGTGDEPIDLSTMPDSAAWTAEVAVDPKVVGVVNVRSERTSFKKVASQVEEEYGTKITLEHSGSYDDAKNILAGLRKSEPDNVYAWMGLAYLVWMTSEKAALKSVDNGKYPMVKPTTVRDFLKQHTLADVTSGY